MIKVSCLNKYYNKGRANEIHVINNTDLILDDTGLVCILGESGSGKTTLMNTISGLDSFVSGTIDVDDMKITKYGSVEQELIRNEKFGYIFQNYYLLMDKSVEYNIMLALSLYDISDEEKEERIDYVLEAVDMSRYKKRIVSQLSGGQQQRIAIARALAKTPKVIFADEPTGNLDEANTMRIMSILKKISSECLVVLVTHERSIADFFADRILKISDGKIIDDRRLENHAVYQFNDDNNIYLQEYKSKKYSNDGVNVETYTNDKVESINIKLIYDNNKVYMYTESDIPVELLTNEDEKKIIDSKKPVIELDDVEMDFELKNIRSSKIPKIGFKEMWSMAKENLAVLGKKQIFLVISLFVMAVLLVLTVQDIMSIVVINEEDVVTTDRNIIDVTLKKNKSISDEEYAQAKQKLVENLKNSGMDLELYIEPNIYFTYSYSGFWQLENIQAELRKFSLVGKSKLDESSLVYGRKPEKQGEIVIDRWVIDLFLKDNPELANVITNVQHFMGKTLYSSASKAPYTIVGITDSGNPDIFVDETEMLGMCSKDESICELGKLREDSGVDRNIVLKEGEALVGETLFNKLVDIYFSDNYKLLYRYINGYNVNKSVEEMEEQYGITLDEFEKLYSHPESLTYTYVSTIGMTFTVIGSIPDDAGVDIVVADGSCEKMISPCVYAKNFFRIYSNDKEEIKEYLKDGLPEDIIELVNVNATDSYEEKMSEYKSDLKIKFDARIVVTVTIFGVSMIILYFMMKANAVSKITDLGVYRLLGISKKSIVGMFMLENAMLSTYTSLPGVLGTTIVTKFLSNIPALQMNIIYPWYAVVLTILFIYVLNIFVGVLPVKRILKLPPAQLAAKYDI